jgi:hypothetical protein
LDRAVLSQAWLELWIAEVEISLIAEEAAFGAPLVVAVAVKKERD